MKSKNHKKKLHNVGITDLYVGPGHDLCPIYRIWGPMLARCYSKASLKRNPTYSGCIVVDDWHLFSNFKNWVMSQDYIDKFLDKDVLVSKNKVYGPDTCAFVTREVNNLLNTRKKSRGMYPIGVSYDSRKSKFEAKIGIQGKSKFLGHFKTPEEAAIAYLTKKSEVVLEVASRTMDVKVKLALQRIANEIESGNYY